MSLPKRRLSNALVLMSLFPCATWASSDTGSEFEFDGELQLGAEYNTNVHIKELELASGESDISSILAGQLNGHWRPTDKLKLDMSYSLRQQEQLKASQFDSQLQLMSADLSYGFDLFTLGSNFYHANAKLADDPFLTMQQASLYGAGFASDKLYLRASLTLADKEFDKTPMRDADNTTLTTDLYYFLDSGKSFVSLGISYGEEEAKDTAFSYHNWGAKLGWSTQTVGWEMEQKWQLGWQWDKRDYSKGITSANAASDSKNIYHFAPYQSSSERNDYLNKLYASWEIAFTSYLALETKLEYGDTDSSLSSADYRDTRSSMLLKVRF
jgi:hypothetical protein